MDELLNRLKNARVGCYIGNMFLGVLRYADDYVYCPPPAIRDSISLTVWCRF